MNLIKVITLLVLFMLGGCATTNVPQEEASLNHRSSGKFSEEMPPIHHSSKKFSEYKQVFIKPLAIPAEFQNSNSNKKAITMLNDLLYKNMLPIFPSLEKFSDYYISKTKNALIIEPHIEKIKYVTKGQRGALGLLCIVCGALAGNSTVILQVSYMDAKSKEIIASPSFYQHANAFGASFSQNDLDMLDRITELASFYAADNF
ncbi:MAG: hypothetical protein ABL903_02600 [Methylococcales bacterium]